MTSDHPRHLICCLAVLLAIVGAAGVAAETIAGTDHLKAAELVAGLPWAFEVTSEPIEPGSAEGPVRATSHRFKSATPIDKTAAGEVYLRAELTNSAAKEALEEAGIEGAVSPRSAGTYRYDKWGGTSTVDVFPMEVETLHESWLESFRERQWVSLDEAVLRVREEKLRQILRRLPDHLAESTPMARRQPGTP